MSCVSTEYLYKYGFFIASDGYIHFFFFFFFLLDFLHGISIQQIAKLIV